MRLSSPCWGIVLSNPGLVDVWVSSSIKVPGMDRHVLVPRLFESYKDAEEHIAWLRTEYPANTYTLREYRGPTEDVVHPIDPPVPVEVAPPREQTPRAAVSTDTGKSQPEDALLEANTKAYRAFFGGEEELKEAQEMLRLTEIASKAGLHYSWVMQLLASLQVTLIHLGQVQAFPRKMQVFIDVDPPPHLKHLDKDYCVVEIQGASDDDFSFPARAAVKG